MSSQNTSINKSIFNYPVFDWNISLATLLLKKLHEEENAWSGGDVMFVKMKN